MVVVERCAAPAPGVTRSLIDTEFNAILQRRDAFADFDRLFDQFAIGLVRTEKHFDLATWRLPGSHVDMATIGEDFLGVLFRHRRTRPAFIDFTVSNHILTPSS